MAKRERDFKLVSAKDAKHIIQPKPDDGRSQLKKIAPETKKARFVESCLSPPDTVAASDDGDDKLANFFSGPLASEWRSRYEDKIGQIWIDLCHSDPLAIGFSQAFLKAYVRLGTVTRLTLGPEEVIEKTLIAEVDDYILMPLRNADPDNSSHLLLKHPKGWLGAHDEGPVAQVIRWIYGDGAIEMNLSTQPKYKKVSLTVEDISLLLETLWLRADDIPMPSFLHRIIFHIIVLLLAFGFRSGMVMNAKYRDFELAIVRDPANRTRRKRHVLTPTIYRNKLKRSALKHDHGTE
ncbi:hypothetical protein ACMFMF_003769 [Clarireedia jacksonii]